MKFTRIVMGLILEKYTIFSVKNKDIFLSRKILNLISGTALD